MRYFLAGFVLLTVLVVGMAGFRGGKSRQPPLEIFPDMDRQPKLQPQHESDVFPDRRSSRPPVAGTIARTAPMRLSSSDPQKVVYAFESSAAATGLVSGTTNFVETTPFEVTAQFMERGRERYQIACLPCHGPIGDGNGITRKFGMAVLANLHEPRIVKMPDGELFHVITNGRNLMGGYGPVLSIEERWAVIAYVRALQLSRLASLDDVPEQLRATLKK